MKPGKRREKDDEAEQPNAGVPGIPPGEDARQDAEKLKENREKLGVGEDHKTPEMGKGHRGTFP